MRSISNSKVESYDLSVNGETHTIEALPETPLLYILRNQLTLYGPKYGCGLGQCGSCMVLIEGRPVMSCIMSVQAVGTKKIGTVSGLVGNNGDLHPVQQAFLDEHAAQCGYCTNGMIMSAVALLDRNPSPDLKEIHQSMQINLCRCGSQSRIIRAIQRAANHLSEEK